MKKFVLFLAISLISIFSFAQKPASGRGPYYIDNDSMMVTVFLRHQQENPVDSIQGRVMKQKFYEKLSQSHARVLSWNVVMGIGQIITLRFKPEYVREVNQVFESGAWGGFNTEFYPTYDFIPIYPKMLEKEEQLYQDRR